MLGFRKRAAPVVCVTDEVRFYCSSRFLNSNCTLFLRAFDGNFILWVFDRQCFNLIVTDKVMRTDQKMNIQFTYNKIAAIPI